MIYVMICGKMTVLIKIFQHRKHFSLKRVKDMKKDRVKSNKEESTIFGVRNKSKSNAQTSTKSKISKKVVIWVAVALIALFVVLPWGIVQIVKISENTLTPFSERGEDVVATDYATEVFLLKSSDFKNINATEKILDTLCLVDRLYGYTVSVKTGDVNTIVVTFNQSHHPTMDKEYEETMINYSCAIMALVENADMVEWKYPSTSQGDEGGAFSRADGLTYLGYPLSEYAKTKEGIQMLLVDIGLSEDLRGYR